jgi:hypothetical protein
LITKVKDVNRYKNFTEFWPFYVLEHSKPATRSLHFAGTSLLILCLAGIAVTGSVWFLLYGIVLAYGFAWTGHFFVERNRPATFRYPFLSLLGDFKMYGLMLAGKMTNEVENCRRLKTPAS